MSDAHQVHNYAGFTVRYGWIPREGEGRDETEPAMFLYRNRPKKRALSRIMSGVDRANEDRLPHAIGLSSAYKYADSKTGGPSQYLLSQGMVIAQRWWGNPSQSEFRRVCDAIVDCLPELVEMPPAPPPSESVMQNRIDREVDSISVNGEKIIET